MWRLYHPQIPALLIISIKLLFNALGFSWFWFFFHYQQAALETKNNSRIFKKLNLLWACSIKNHLQFLAGKLGISNQFLEIS